jgi:hypothetical protein
MLWREGVDVPEWDLVVLADPVKSPVVAKQIIGRASRPHPGKECGYVFIPHIFDEETGFEVGGGGYSEFVSVFQSMVEDDPQLQKDVLFVTEMTERNGKSNVTDFPLSLLETFQLPETVSLGIRQNFIQSVVMELVGTNNVFPWMGWYALLKRYKDREGNCLVPEDHVEEGKNLGRWTSMQRDALRTGGMTIGKKQRLDEIGFIWDVRAYKWERSFGLLERFAEREGHCDVPQRHEEDGEPLGKWLEYQRTRFRKGTLEISRQMRLEELGVILNFQANDRQWVRNFNLLVKFKEREGHCNVPTKHKEDGKNLGYWLIRQKQAHANGTLDPERYQKLKKLDVEW